MSKAILDVDVVMATRKEVRSEAPQRYGRLSDLWGLMRKDGPVRKTEGWPML